MIASLRALLIDTRQLDVIEPFITIPLGEFSLPAISLAWRLTLAGYPATSRLGLHRTP